MRRRTRAATRLRAAETTFLNFDTVGGDVPLTYILREGTGAITRPAPPHG